MQGLTDSAPPRARDLRVAGLLVALGAAGVVVTSAFYAVSNPAAGLPAQPFDATAAMTGAVRSAATLKAAGTIGYFADVAAAVGCVAVAIGLARRDQPLASAGWLGVGLATLMFAIVDTTAGYVLPPMAAAGEAGAFAGFKRLFDALFLFNTIAFGISFFAALGAERRSLALTVGAPLALAGQALGALAVTASVACLVGLPLEQGVGLSVAASAIMLMLIGRRVAQADCGPA